MEKVLLVRARRELDVIAPTEACRMGSDSGRSCLKDSSCCGGYGGQVQGSVFEDNDEQLWTVCQG